MKKTDSYNTKENIRHGRMKIVRFIDANSAVYCLCGVMREGERIRLLAEENVVRIHLFTCKRHNIVFGLRLQCSEVGLQDKILMPFADAEKISIGLRAGLGMASQKSVDFDERRQWYFDFYGLKITRRKDIVQAKQKALDNGCGSILKEQ